MRPHVTRQMLGLFKRLRADRTFQTNVPHAESPDKTNLHEVVRALNPSLFHTYASKPGGYEASQLHQAVDLMRRCLATDHTRRITAANALGTYGRTLTNSIESFERLTESRYLNRQPVRLDLVRASRTAPFRSFLADRPEPLGLDAEGLAILNQVSLDGTVEAGVTLKLPQR